MKTDKNIELHIPSVMGYEKIAMECAASMAKPCLRIVQPDTVVRWHRAGFRLFWKWKSRQRRGGRRPIDGELVSLIRQMSRTPAERSTTYQKVRVFETEDNHRDLLDEINDPSERFGSYQNLIHLKDYRFRDFYKEQRTPKQ